VIVPPASDDDFLDVLALTPAERDEIRSLGASSAARAALLRAIGELREGARHAAALASLGELAMNAEDVQPFLRAACATAAELLALDAVALVEASGHGGRIRAAAGLARDVVSASAPHGGTPASPGGLLAELGFQAAHEVSLPGRERVARVLGAYSRAPRSFTPVEMRFLEATASALASALARHHAEQEMLDRERQMRAVFDSALDAMVILSGEGTIVDANPAASALLATARAALAGRALDEVAPLAPPPAGGPPARWQALLARARSSAEVEVVLCGARPRHLELSTARTMLAGQSLLVLRDVTEKRQLQARLALADRMVSVGTLAAGVAHELNNPLAYVNANLAFLGERLGRVAQLLAGAPATRDDGDLAAQLAEAVRDARDGAERMRLIIRDLKTFSRADEERSGPVALGPVLESCLNMAWNEIRHRARLVRELAAVPLVHGAEARLGQVFLNLLVNAAQAIPEGHAEQHTIRVATRLLDDGRVATEVQDSGCGIAPDQLPRIFDPFYTTKPPGVGTGLGLSICHSIVTSFGGDIEVESLPGTGSTFRVILRPDAGAPDAPAPVAARPVRRRARLLVVDDEPLVGNVLQRTLSDEHDVTVVSSARAALERVSAGEPFDLVMSDLLMPEMSGMDLYRALAASAPRLARRMIFLTGGAFTQAAREFLQNERVLCLEKPFELPALRALVATRLAADDEA
jgi:PAS domain S-box-containing protein